ncbi:hypothetical protein BKA70DRAFT_1557308 [Coprinopsis sp. MPI-PUGE-AT-0042]|nr:hypothetical protein BKA70DRAFT_1557308 [Coprinopsis sp. MPI-PUGE-AT-0042]
MYLRPLRVPARPCLDNREAVSSSLDPTSMSLSSRTPIHRCLVLHGELLSWVIEATALIAIALCNGQRCPPNWPNFADIVLLLIDNSVICNCEARDCRNRRLRPCKC